MSETQCNLKPASPPLGSYKPKSPQVQQKSQTLSKMESQINLHKLKQLIRNGITSIPKDETANEAIIVVGDTGVGKSTIMNYLAGNKLIVKSEGLKPKLVTQGFSVIKIGHDKYSETSIPTRVYIGGLAFYDCPGFRDNKGEEYEISNSFFVQKLLEIYQKVKIVLLIDESHISESRADKLPRLTKNLLRSFKSFNDIKQGVILIINRADPELSQADYSREIIRLSTLSNQHGFLFGEEQQHFLQHLAQNNRVKLFKMPQKKDKGKQFIGTSSEKDILPSIRRLDFVKSRSISNIVSESAKIAIRDYIDDVTIKSNVKIQRVSSKIAENVFQLMSAAGKDINKLLEIKDNVLRLSEEVKGQSGEHIMYIIKKELPDYDTKDFEYDFESIIFFKGIYDKADTYFSNLVNKTYSELSLVLTKLDFKIGRLQKEEQDELERRQLILRRQEIQNQRNREKLETMERIKQINELRHNINEVSRTSNSIIKSMSDTLNFVGNLEQELVNLKVDASRLQVINHELNKEFLNFSALHLKNAA